jgi:hypothetical protein
MVTQYAGRKLIADIMALTIGQSRITSGTHCPHVDRLRGLLCKGSRFDGRHEVKKERIGSGEALPLAYA